MQTFLPYPDFKQSAACLDRQRLGKQRVEVLQLVKALFTNTGGWVNHPAAKMWRGHLLALCAYGVAVCDEWVGRGYKDTCRDKLRGQWSAVLVHPPYNLQRWERDVTTIPYTLPSWFGDKLFHASHRSNLLRKDPTWYGQFGWIEPPILEYVWPTP